MVTLFITRLESPTYRRRLKIEKVDFERYRKEWSKTRRMLMSIGWTGNKSRSIVNFLVNNQSETIFLKSGNTSGISKLDAKLFDLLDSMI